MPIPTGEEGNHWLSLFLTRCSEAGLERVGDFVVIETGEELGRFFELFEQTKMEVMIDGQAD